MDNKTVFKHKSKEKNHMEHYNTAAVSNNWLDYTQT